MTFMCSSFAQIIILAGKEHIKRNKTQKVIKRKQALSFLRALKKENLAP
jgi:hypothetical protein